MKNKVVSAELRKPPENCGVTQAAPGGGKAKEYLLGWPEILRAINRKGTDKETVRGMNKNHGGPIIFPGRGPSQRSTKATLGRVW